MDTSNTAQTPHSPQITPSKIRLVLPEFDTPPRSTRICLSNQTHNRVSPTTLKQEEDTVCAHALLNLKEYTSYEQCNNEYLSDEQDVEKTDFYDTKYVSDKEAISSSKMDDKCLGIFQSGERYVTRTVHNANTPWSAFDNVNWKYIRCWIKVEDEFKPVMAHLDTAEIVHRKRGCVRRVYSWKNGWKIKVHHTTCMRQDTYLCHNCIRKRHCHRGSVTLRIESPFKWIRARHACDVW